MTCASCGAGLRPGAMFCGECGQRTAQRSIEFPPPPEVPAPVVSEVPDVQASTVALTRIAPAPVLHRSEPAQVPLADSSVELDDDVDRTILAPRRLPPWTITGPDGVTHSIRVATVIGRSPLRPAHRPGIELLALDDPTRSLSKSHAIVEPDGDSLVVEDLGSTNGVVRIEPDGSETELPAGHRVAVPAGAVLEFGDYVITVGRG